MNRRIIVIACFVLLMSLNSGVSRAQAISSANTVSPDARAIAETFSAEYRIEPENVLSLEINYGKGESSTRQVRVSSSGEINVAYFGDLEVGGLTIPELQKRLNKLFDKGELIPPQVTVSIIEYSRVTVIGEVKMPGVYPIKSTLTAIELIAQAEGFRETASVNEVKIIRTNPDGTKKVIPVRINDTMTGGIGANDSVFLRSRDVVIVPKNMVTILGEVKLPGAYPISTTLTVVELVALAGGFNESASLNEVKVIHNNPDGTANQRMVPLYDFMSKESAENNNYPLSSGDVVIVPKSTVTLIGEVVKPGVYPIRGRLTLIDLVAMGEGVTKFASPNEIRVTHMGSDGRKVDRVVPLYDMMKRGETDNGALDLFSGDVVFVR